MVRRAAPMIIQVFIITFGERPRMSVCHAHAHHLARNERVADGRGIGKIDCPLHAGQSGHVDLEIIVSRLGIQRIRNALDARSPCGTDAAVSQTLVENRHLTSGTDGFIEQSHDGGILLVLGQRGVALLHVEHICVTLFLHVCGCQRGGLPDGCANVHFRRIRRFTATEHAWNITVTRDTAFFCLLPRDVALRGLVYPRLEKLHEHLVEIRCVKLVHRERAPTRRIEIIEQFRELLELLMHDGEDHLLAKFRLVLVGIIQAPIADHRLRRGGKVFIRSIADRLLDG